MTRVLVLGATGHIGSYLVPRLVRAGHEVVAASRGTREPYPLASGAIDPGWAEAERVALDREATDADGTTAAAVLAHRPDVVVDLVCFTPESAVQLVGGLRGRIDLLAHCGTVWTHGLSRTLPIGEDDPKEPFGEYGVAKYAIERLLRAETAGGGLDATVIHPGHISGPGWPVINPVGNLDPAVWATIAGGAELTVPGDASATMHHVHADDVAQLFELAIARPAAATGRSFHAVSARALTVRGYAAGAAAWWGQPSVITPTDWATYREGHPEHAEVSWQHLHRSQVCAIDQAVARLGYAPAYSSLDAAREAVAWLAANDPEHDLPALLG